MNHLSHTNTGFLSLLLISNASLGYIPAPFKLNYKNTVSYYRTFHYDPLYMNKAKTQFPENTVNDQKRILNEIVGLTKSFEDVQANIATSEKTYLSKITSYKSQINELKSVIQRIEKEKILYSDASESVTADHEAQIKALKDEIANVKERCLKKIADVEKEMSEKNLILTKQKDDEIVRLTASMSTALLTRDEEIVRLRTNLSSLESRKDQEEDKIREECRKENRIEREKELVIWANEKESLLKRLQSLQDEIEGVKLRSARELMAVRKRPLEDQQFIDQISRNAIEEIDEVVQGLKVKVYKYESERNSLRKLTALGFKRVWDIIRFRKR